MITEEYGTDTLYVPEVDLVVSKYDFTNSDLARVKRALIQLENRREV